MKTVDIEFIKKIVKLATPEGTVVTADPTECGWILTANSSVHFPDQAWTTKTRNEIRNEYGSDFRITFDGAVHGGMITRFHARTDAAAQPKAQILSMIEALFCVSIDMLQIHKTCNFIYTVKADDKTLTELLPIFVRLKMQDVEIVKTTSPSTLVGFLDTAIK